MASICVHSLYGAKEDDNGVHHISEQSAYGKSCDSFNALFVCACFWYEMYGVLFLFDVNVFFGCRVLTEALVSKMEI